MTKIYKIDGFFLGEFDISPRADLSNVDLRNAYLQCADLRCAHLRGANLQGADLRRAYLYGANLSNANLRDADLQNAILQNADLQNAILPDFQIPQGKSLIVWKKVEFGGFPSFAIAKLRIPSEAKRTASLVGKKCRAERAFVEDIYDLRTKEKIQRGFSMHDHNFIYEVGKEVNPANGYDDDIRFECRPGIHFFMTEDEAINYSY